MTAPPLKPKVLTCRKKRRHADELTARAAAMSHIERGLADVGELYVYQCPECAGWHLTKSRQRAAVTADDPFLEK